MHCHGYLSYFKASKGNTVLRWRPFVNHVVCRQAHQIKMLRRFQQANAKLLRGH